MSTSESISNLFNLGVDGIKIGKTPQNAPAPFFCACEQALPQGEPGNMTSLQHQVIGNTVGECIREMAARVEAFSNLQKQPSAIVKLPTARN